MSEPKRAKLRTQSARISPAGAMTVTRVRTPASVQTARVTVLFADLRGYTGMAERMPAAHVLPLLDEFFRVLAAATHNCGGEIFHMAGDGIMAGFGVDTDDGDGAAEALAAGHAILGGFAPIAARWRRELEVEAGIGIGLHLGEVAVGLLGPPRRRTPTLVGDTVNVAARLCSRARAGEVLFSCTVAAALANVALSPTAQSDGGIANPAGLLNEHAAPFLQLPQFELRGRREPIDIWCVPAVARLAL